MQLMENEVIEVKIITEIMKIPIKINKIKIWRLNEVLLAISLIVSILSSLRYLLFFLEVVSVPFGAINIEASSNSVFVLS